MHSCKHLEHLTILLSSAHPHHADKAGAPAGAKQVQNALHSQVSQAHHISKERQTQRLCRKKVMHALAPCRIGTCSMASRYSAVANSTSCGDFSKDPLMPVEVKDRPNLEADVRYRR